MKFLAALIIGFAFVAAAAAKEGVVAHLQNPDVLRAAPGAKVTLVWTLRADKRPFTAQGIYVRLRGVAATSAPAGEIGPGRFRARVTIPRGGVRSIVIAVMGWTSGLEGTRRADMRFRIDNDPTL
jgi:hypothetical protein